MTVAAAGWYRDPEDPVRLRHWDGRSYDLRRRTLPPWALGTRAYVPTVRPADDGPVLDGPVHPAVLPATVTATVPASRHRRPSPVPPRGRTRVTDSTTRASVSVPPSRHRPTGRSAWPKRRAASATVMALVVAAMLVVATTVGLAPHAGAPADLAQEPAFVLAANTACGETMGAIRTPAAPGDGPVAVPGGGATSAVAAANRRLSILAGRLRALPVADGLRASVGEWLDDWTRFASDRSLAAAGHSSAATVALDAGAADAVATSNGLSNCLLEPAGSQLTAS